MRAITKKMGRSHTTISRELYRNQDPSLKTYLPDSANSQAQERRHNAQELFQSFTSQQIDVELMHADDPTIVKVFFKRSLGRIRQYTSTELVKACQ